MSLIMRVATRGHEASSGRVDGESRLLLDAVHLPLRGAMIAHTR